MHFLTKPNYNTFMFACDVQYFKKYGVNCANSAIKTGTPIHAHVLNPDRECDVILNDLRSDYFSASTSLELDKDKLTKEHYCKLRFLILNDLLSVCNKVCAIDTDSIFLKQAMSIFDYDLGIHERNMEPKEFRKVLAGVVLVSQKCQEFVNLLYQKQKEIEDYWYADQIALYRTIVEYKKTDEFKTIKYIDVPLDFVDYTFNPNSYIWTGKGDRKNNNRTYLNEFIKHKRF